MERLNMANDIDPSKIVWDNAQPIDASQVQWDFQRQVPQWGQENPRLYEAAQVARQYGAPIVEGLGMVGGGIIGAPAGPIGAVGGAGLGYGAARQMVNLADVALGNKPRQELPKQSKEAVKDVIEGAAYEAGGRVLGDVAGAIAKAIPESVKATPEKIASFLRAREAGYVVPPSQMKSDWTTRALESISGKAETSQIASLKNQETTNKLARQSLGLSPEVPLSKESMESYRAAQSAQGYDPVKQIGNIDLGQGFDQSLNAIKKANTGKGTIPAAENQAVSELIDSYKTGNNTIVDSDDAIKAIRKLRKEAKSANAKGDFALEEANLSIANAYEDAIENSLQSANQTDLLRNYKTARQNIAKSFDVESALKEGSGNVDAKKLAALLQKGKYLSGELKSAAEFGNVFKQAARTPEEMGSPAVGALRPYASTVLAGLGGTLAGAPGAIAGGALGMASPAAARSVLFSPAMQARLAQAPQPAMTAEALRRYAPNAIRSLPIIGNQFTGNQ
jgi:hypothetical protein